MMPLDDAIITDLLAWRSETMYAANWKAGRSGTET
jgi:hypothetical protein